MERNFTSLSAVENTFQYGWVIGLCICALCCIIIIIVVIFKCSSKWHQYRLSQAISSPPEGLQKAPTLPFPRKLRVLSLNMFLRPWGIADDENDDYKDERLLGFCETYLNEFDVICLQECFSTMNYRKTRFIKRAFRCGFHFFAESPPPKFCSTKFVDGGLLILSRLPFVCEPSFKSYSAGKGADKMADKGILHVCIRLPHKGQAIINRHKGAGKIINENENGTLPNQRLLHVFCTHLQATYAKIDWEATHVQIKQLGEMRNFIDEKLLGNQPDAVRYNTAHL